MSIKVSAFNDYAITERISVDMISIALAQIDTPKGTGYTFIYGFFEFQYHSLLKTSQIIKTKYNDTVLNNS